jgi:hypothetical protein
MNSELQKKLAKQREMSESGAANNKLGHLEERASSGNLNQTNDIPPPGL